MGKERQIAKANRRKLLLVHDNLGQAGNTMVSYYPDWNSSTETGQPFPCLPTFSVICSKAVALYAKHLDCLCWSRASFLFVHLHLPRILSTIFMLPAQMLHRISKIEKNSFSYPSNFKATLAPGT